MTAQAQRPLHHANSKGTLFVNPWSEAKPVSFSNWSLPAFLAQGWGGFPFEWAKEHTNHPHKPIEVVKPDFNDSHEDIISATWLGHASFLVTLPLDGTGPGPVRILFDPIFSERAGPSQWAGPRRRLPPPCTIDELPEIQFVVISHNHYDHLDVSSILSIQSKSDRIQYLVPLGNKTWITSCGISENRVVELDWWEHTNLTAKQFDGTSFGKIRFICTPAQHNSGRGVWDQATSLWSSWVIEQNIVKPDSNSVERNTAIFFAGDTGYITNQGACPVFKEIGEKYGPFDLSMLPIWRGGTLQFIARMGLKLTDHKLTSSVHATPEHALCIHRDIKSRHSIGMHFATFAGSDIEAFEPIVELTQEQEKIDIGDWYQEGGFGVIDIGETAKIPLDYTDAKVLSGS